MAGLPAGWEADYDGKRWFYKYKANGHVQYHFPSEGDEFPDFIDDTAPAPVLAPEERLESQQQVKRLGGSRPTTHSDQASTLSADQAIKRNGDWSGKMNAQARPVSAIWEDDNLVSDAKEEPAVFQPENFMYLGPGTYTDVSPMVDEEDEAAKRVVAGGTGATSEQEVSPEMSAKSTPQLGNSNEKMSPLQRVVSPEVVSITRSPTQPPTWNPNAFELEVQQPVIQLPASTPETLHLVNGPEVIAELPGSTPYDNPVGIIAELPTRETGKAHIETNPDPIEIGEGRELSFEEARATGALKAPERSLTSSRRPTPLIEEKVLGMFVEQTGLVAMETVGVSEGLAGTEKHQIASARYQPYKPRLEAAEDQPIRLDDRSVLSLPTLQRERWLVTESSTKGGRRQTVSHNDGQQSEVIKHPSILRPARGRAPSLPATVQPLRTAGQPTHASPPPASAVQQSTVLSSLSRPADELPGASSYEPAATINNASDNVKGENGITEPFQTTTARDNKDVTSQHNLKAPQDAPPPVPSASLSSPAHLQKAPSFSTQRKAVPVRTSTKNVNRHATRSINTPAPSDQHDKPTHPPANGVQHVADPGQETGQSGTSRHNISPLGSLPERVPSVSRIASPSTTEGMIEGLSMASLEQTISNETTSPQPPAPAAHSSETQRQLFDSQCTSYVPLNEEVSVSGDIQRPSIITRSRKPSSGSRSPKPSSPDSLPSPAVTPLTQVSSRTSNGERAITSIDEEDGTIGSQPESARNNFRDSDRRHSLAYGSRDVSESSLPDHRKGVPQAATQPHQTRDKRRLRRSLPPAIRDVQATMFKPGQYEEPRQAPILPPRPEQDPELSAQSSSNSSPVERQMRSATSPSHTQDRSSHEAPTGWHSWVSTSAPPREKERRWKRWFKMTKSISPSSSPSPSPESQEDSQEEAPSQSSQVAIVQPIITVSGPDHGIHVKQVGVPASGHQRSGSTQTEQGHLQRSNPVRRRSSDHPPQMTNGLRMNPLYVTSSDSVSSTPRMGKPVTQIGRSAALSRIAVPVSRSSLQLQDHQQ